MPTQAEYEELERMAVEWIKARDSLSSDCLRLGISGSAADMPKWQDELNRRESPFRRFMERWVWETYLGTSAPPEPPRLGGKS